MKQAPERRQYKRIKKHFILTYFDLSEPAARHEASQVKNISMGGMCLITQKPFTPEAILGIELKTPLQTELTYLQGTVLESHEKIKEIIYETRLVFGDLSPQAMTVLDKMIQYFEKEESNRDE